MNTCESIPLSFHKVCLYNCTFGNPLLSQFRAFHHGHSFCVDKNLVFYLLNDNQNLKKKPKQKIIVSCTCDIFTKNQSERNCTDNINLFKKI